MDKIIIKTKTCIYCHQPLIESDTSIYPFYCSNKCMNETGKSLKEYFDDLGSDLGTGG